MTEPNEDVGTNALEPTSVPAAENLETGNVSENAALENLENTEETAASEIDSSPKEHGNKGRVTWWQDRINEETNQKRLLKQQLEQERREKQEAQALLERFQGGDKKEPPAPRQENVDIEALVEARAARKLFDADCDAAANAWQAEMPESFKPSLDILSNVDILPHKDGTNTEFMEDILAVDKAGAHKILDALAKDPDRAFAMRNMSSRSRIAALTRMQMTEATKPALTAPAAPKPSISKVPPPKPVIDAVSDDAGETDLANDKLDDRTWSKIWDKKYRKTA